LIASCALAREQDEDVETGVEAPVEVEGAEDRICMRSELSSSQLAGWCHWLDEPYVGRCPSGESEPTAATPSPEEVEAAAASASPTFL